MIDTTLQILESHAVDGKFRAAPKGVTMDDLVELSDAGLLDRQKVDGGYEYILLDAAARTVMNMQAAATPISETEIRTPSGKSVPKPKVLYREPVDQAEHRRAVRAILRGGGITRSVALEAHDQIGMTYAEHKGYTPFGEIKRELSPKYLAGFVGFGLTSIKEAMTAAVEAGLFLRVDNGAGGKGNTNGSTYKAIVPAELGLGGRLTTTLD